MISGAYPWLFPALLCLAASVPAALGAWPVDNSNANGENVVDNPVDSLLITL